MTSGARLILDVSNSVRGGNDESERWLGEHRAKIVFAFVSPLG
jgi:hypothetical protein